MKIARKHIENKLAARWSVKSMHPRHTQFVPSSTNRLKKPDVIYAAWSVVPSSLVQSS